MNFLNSFYFVGSVNFFCLHLNGERIMHIFGGNLEEILVHNHNIPTSLLCVTHAE